MSKGKVKYFNERRGWGIIGDSDFGDIFVHYTAINMDGYRTLQEGQNVAFDLTLTATGQRALNVTPQP